MKNQTMISSLALLALGACKSLTDLDLRVIILDAKQSLSGLRTSHDLAQVMGEKLGRG